MVTDVGRLAYAGGINLLYQYYCRHSARYRHVWNK